MCVEEVEDQVGNDLSGNEGDFWEKMKMLCWCPVVTVAPHPDMPFARASGHLAPPRIARRVGHNTDNSLTMLQTL